MKFLIPSFVFALMTAPAFADVICVARSVANHQASQVCGTVTIPSDSTATTNLTCGDYAITVDCDLHNHALKLSLSIVGPNGAKASISQNSDLNLIDSNGDGALAHCGISN